MYRSDATGEFVLAGIRSDDPLGERALPSFVTAFRRDLRPQMFVVHNDLDFQVAPLFVVSATAGGVLRARYKAQRPTRLGWKLTVFMGFAALLATFAIALMRAIGNALVAG